MTDLSPTSDESTLPDDSQAAVPDRSKAGCVSSTGKFLGHCLVIGSGFLFTTGLLLRLTIRDAIPYVCVFYYATPTIILALAALILSVNRCLLRKWRTAVLWMLTAMLMLGWWHVSTHISQNSRRASLAPESEKKLLFWNLSYIRAGWPAIIEELQKHDADVIGLAEVGPGYPDILNQIRSAFPEHQLVWVRHGILLVRGEAYLLERGELNDHGSYAVVRTRFSDGQQLNLVLVDIYGFILMPRGPAFQSLEPILKTYQESPLCVMGDFNTPPDSVFFDPVRTRFENSYEAAGNGYYVTWPTIAPVLALDQIWLPPETTASSKLYSTPLSDHRLVTARYQPAGKPVQKAAAPANGNPD